MDDIRDSTTGNTARNRSGARRLARSTGIVLAILTAGTAVAACSSSSDPPTAAKATCGGSSPRLTVQGTGLVSGTPNLLTVSVGIDVTDATAAEALSDNNSKVTAVTAVLTQAGVAAKDVQTSDLSINPDYNIKGVITGYGVTNTLSAMLTNFTTAGSVIDSIADAAGNAIRINGLNFSVQDTRALEDRARNDAVRQAVAHAQSMALAAGERLGPVCSLSDQTQTENEFAPNDIEGSAASAAEDKGAVPLEPGSQQETAQVSMVYALMPPKLRK